MAEHTLARTGDAPLVFSGELLAGESGRWHRGRERNRWMDVAIYRLDAGGYVYARHYHTLWEGEDERAEAVLVADDEALRTELRTWHPAEVLGSVGYPPGAQFEQRQTRMLDALDALYRARVSAVLERAGIVERIG